MGTILKIIGGITGSILIVDKSMQLLSKIQPVEDQVIQKILESRRFRYTVDLGCGEGKRYLKDYTKYLIGVDRREEDLIIAKRRGYNEVVKMDFRYYEFPSECDSVTIVESIEHVSKEDGISIIERARDRFILITTPARFFKPARNHHQCLWTKEELESLGFTVVELGKPVYGQLIGVREG